MGKCPKEEFMKKRIITGLLIFLALAGFVALRFVHLLFFDALVLAISCAAGWEMICAYKLADRKSYNAIVFLFPFVIWFCYFFAKDGKTAIVYQFLAMLIVFVLCFVIELLSYKNKNKKNVVEPSSQDLVDNKYLICETFTTLKICFYPLLLVGTLFGINHLGLEMGLIGILLAIAVATFSDMFAFFFGVAFGQGKNCKKLCPHISPKKSVVGFVFGSIGGVLASALVLLFFYFFPIMQSPITALKTGVAVTLFVVIGCIGTLVSQFGDLFSSAFKRRVGIKDFGSFFPGHGGFMDRVDSLMFTSTLVYLCMLCII